MFEDGGFNVFNAVLEEEMRGGEMLAFLDHTSRGERFAFLASRRLPPGPSHTTRIFWSKIASNPTV